MRFYAAEMVSMLAYLKVLHIAHRDLKPDNILVLGELFRDDDDDGDFQQHVSEHRGTFVGTKDYVSPEVLKDLPSNFEADLWALGCIIYQLYTGSLLFKAHTEFLTFQMILNR